MCVYHIIMLLLFHPFDHLELRCFLFLSFVWFLNHYSECTSRAFEYMVKISCAMDLNSYVNIKFYAFLWVVLLSYFQIWTIELLWVTQKQISSWIKTLETLFSTKIGSRNRFLSSQEIKISLLITTQKKEEAKLVS